MASQDELKQQAAACAVEMIESGMVIGLGSGSTATFAVQQIAARLKSGDLENITGIPSSTRTEFLAQDLNIPLVSFNQEQQNTTLDMQRPLVPYIFCKSKRIEMRARQVQWNTKTSFSPEKIILRRFALTDPML